MPTDKFGTCTCHFRVGKGMGVGDGVAVGNGVAVGMAVDVIVGFAATPFVVLQLMSVIIKNSMQYLVAVRCHCSRNVFSIRYLLSDIAKRTTK